MEQRKSICTMCYNGIVSKNVWVGPLKDAKGITIGNALQNFLDESDCKPNKSCASYGCGIYKRSTKSWLHDNNVEII